MKRFLLLIVGIAVWLGSTGTGFAYPEGKVYAKAVKFAKAGQEHFAFMQYNELLRKFPESKYRQLALFATGEYYFRMSGFKQAAAAFETLLKEYPDSQENLYALACLLSMAHQDKNVLSVEDIEKQIIDLQQVSFVFRESKEIAYQSPLYRNYKAIIHIDKIEVYVEGKLLAKVSY